MNAESTLIEMREVGRDEVALIFSFLTIASRMEEQGEPLQKALVDEQLSPYWKGWGRPGDKAIVASDTASGLPVCCAWVRDLPPQHALKTSAQGRVLELAVGTVAQYRGKGIGTAVMRRLLDACQAVCDGISLSVRTTNPALRLYARFGFVKVDGSEHTNRVGSQSITMLLNFRDSSQSPNRSEVEAAKTEFKQAHAENIPASPCAEAARES